MEGTKEMKSFLGLLDTELEHALIAICASRLCGSPEHMAKAVARIVDGMHVEGFGEIAAEAIEVDVDEECAARGISGIWRVIARPFGSYGEYYHVFTSMYDMLGTVQFGW